MQNPHTVRLEIPSAAEYVTIVRHTVQGLAARMGFDTGEIGDVTLAVGEACNNAVRHGCPSSASPVISVVCTVRSASLEVEVSNGLLGGQPRPVIVGDLDRSREGGMGLYIIKNVMDEVHIVWEDCLARVRMVKCLKHPPLAPQS